MATAREINTWDNDVLWCQTFLFHCRYAIKKGHGHARGNPIRHRIYRRRPQASHDDVIKWKHFPRYWPFVRGIHRSPAISPHKGQWRGALVFSLICAWINGCVNNREACDLRRNRVHYDVIVMIWSWGTCYVDLYLLTGGVPLARVIFIQDSLAKLTVSRNLRLWKKICAKFKFVEITKQLVHNTEIVPNQGNVFKQIFSSQDYPIENRKECSEYPHDTHSGLLTNTHKAFINTNVA